MADDDDDDDVAVFLRQPDYFRSLRFSLPFTRHYLQSSCCNTREL